jgi:uroporphyrinogen-III synthase
MPSGSTVVLTRAPADNAPLAVELRARGVTVIELTSARVEPIADDEAVAAAVRALGPDDRLVFTSRAGVDAVRRKVTPHELHAPVAAVGRATAERCAEWGVTAWMPSRPTGAALGRELPFGSGTVLLARADRADPAIVAELAARGARVREIVAYRVVPEANGDVEGARRAAVAGATIVVASPAAVEGLVAAIGLAALGCARVLAIGETTARAVSRITGDEPRVLHELSADAIVRDRGEAVDVAGD